MTSFCMKMCLTPCLALSVWLGGLQIALGDEKSPGDIPTSQAFYDQAIADSKGKTWKPLTNGKNLDGWKVVLQGQKPGDDPESIFQVVDKEIHVYRDTPAGKKMPFGVILSDESFSEYRFRFEYRWGEKKFAPRMDKIRDAGLLYHVVGPEKVWPMSVECQVQEGDTGDNFLVYTGCDSPVNAAGNKFLDVANGGKWKGFYNPGRVTRVIKSETLEQPEWNLVEVIVRGDKAVHIVNGKINNYLINMRAPIGPDGAMVPLTKGRLALQCEGAELFYRNLELLDLSSSEKTSFVPADESIAPIPPRSPNESLAAWKVRDGMRIELVAAEPLLMDPVAIDWGLDGKLWVIEMADYPLGMDGKGKSGGRIRVLEKSQPNGPYDRSTLFLDGINFPTGIVSWKNGVIVTAAPEIFYAEDTDGDGVCDKKKVLFSGFHEGNQQLRINGLRWGLDGWLHCASGSHHAGYGSKSRVHSHVADREIALGSRDFRFHPETGELEPLSGPSQFGRNRDEYDNWFGTQNSYPLWHYLYENHYLGRNAFLTPPDPRVLLTENSARVFPIAEIEAQPNPHTRVGRFTSACSGMVYCDNLLPTENGTSQAFTCEPVHNLVQRHLLTRDGVSFKRTRDVEGEAPDFLASTDRWCRPVMVRTGPDGALWVVDMYRYIIEHPEWVPKAAQKELEPYLRLGDGRGRIYRVLPVDGQGRDIPEIMKLNPIELVSLFEHPNAWVRDAAQCRLREQNSAEAIPALKSTVRNGKTAQSRLHALYTLSNLKSCDTDDLVVALQDSSLEIRRHALKLAEQHQSPPAEVWAAIRPLINDPSEAVRLQLAFSLGEWTGPDAIQVFVQLWSSQNLSSPIQTALISSLNTENTAAAIHVVAGQSFSDPMVQERYRLLLRQSLAMGSLVPVEFSLKNRLGSENELARAMLALSVTSRHSPASVNQLVQTDIADVRQQAQIITENQSAPAWMRILGVSLLLNSTTDDKADQQSIQRLLASDVPAVVRGEVVRLLGERKDVASGALLLEGWPGYLPAMKNQVLETLAARPEWYGLLVAAMEQRTIQPGEINLTLRQRFLSQKKSPVIQQLQQYFQPAETSNVSIDEILKLQGNLQRGQQVFQKHCTECHQFQGEGFLVGPNLSSVTGRTPASLLEAIVDPNKAVEPKYFNYTIALIDGRILSGLIESDFDHSLSLLKAKGEKTHVLKNEIDELKSTGKSLMPEGFDKTINHQELADLILYLQQ